MKKNMLSTLILTLAVVLACCSKKDSAKNPDSKTTLNNVTWVLEYISGTKIAFDGLYPEEKPTLILNEAERSYGGNSSCNAYTGALTKKEKSIHFGDATKTMRFCEGGGEETFLGMLGKVNQFSIDNDGKLLLLKDDVVVMRFKKAPNKQP